MDQNKQSLDFLISENAGVLRQGITVIKSIDDDQYSRPVEGSGTDSSLGKHFRHVINFYENLLSPVDGTIDYDRRIRDPELETRCSRAADKMEELLDQLNKLGNSDLNGSEQNGSETHGSKPNDSKDGLVRRIRIGAQDDLTVPSDIRRELKFVLEHSIHHYALIGLILRQRGVGIPDHFGVAPSTIAYVNNRNS